MSAREFPPRLLWLLAGLALAWGFNWTAMKVTLSEFAPWTFRAICLSLGPLLLFAWLRASGEPLGPPARREWPRMFLLAVLNITVWNVLVAIALTMIPSGRAAILAYTLPVFSVPLSMLVLGERITPARALGLALGITGLALLLVEDFAALAGAPLGSLLVLVSAACWGLGTVLQKRWPATLPLPAYTAWLMVLGGLPVFAGALVFEILPGRVTAPSFWPAMGIVYNVVIAFAWGHWAWVRLMHDLPVSVFSVAMLVVPVVGVFSGMLFLGERPSVAEVTALVLVVAAQLAILRPRR